MAGKLPGPPGAAAGCWCFLDEILHTFCYRVPHPRRRRLAAPAALPALLWVWVCYSITFHIEYYTPEKPEFLVASSSLRPITFILKTMQKWFAMPPR